MNKEKQISKSEKRWLAREIESGRMTIAEATKHIAGYSKNPEPLIRTWMSSFASDIPLTLPVMTEKEKRKLEAARQRVQKLEKLLEDAQMKNIALETMIDLAEEKLRISIRKKSGLKQ